MSEQSPRTVRISCPCRGPDGATLHPGGDTVELREALDWRAGATARNSVQLARAADPDLPAGEILTILEEVYVLHGVEAWSLQDADRKPLPVTRPNIRAYLLSDQTRALVVADAADDLYAEAVMVPLLQEAQPSSPAMPTETSTSATNGSSETPAPSKRSKRSSTSTTLMAGTDPTISSPAGVFS